MIINSPGLFIVSLALVDKTGSFYSCKDCLGPNSPCGWCNLNKQCSGASAHCRNASHFLQVSSVTMLTCDSIYILCTGVWRQ